MLKNNHHLIQKDLKVVLFFYFLGLCIQVILSTLILIFYQNMQSYGPVLISLEAVMSKLTLFLFLFILFKMKKIQIMLDLNGGAEDALSDSLKLSNISHRLRNFMLISRTFLVLFITNLLF